MNGAKKTKRKQWQFGNAVLYRKFIQCIAERRRTKENRVKGNQLGKSDEKEISNISGG